MGNSTPSSMTRPFSRVPLQCAEERWSSEMDLCLLTYFRSNKEYVRLIENSFANVAIYLMPPDTASCGLKVESAGTVLRSNHSASCSSEISPAAKLQKVRIRSSFVAVT